MNRYDYIIIGAGMGGLSAANFLAKFSKRVLVLEKHSIPGGFCTSFKRKETQFDCGIDGLCELKPNETIPQFFKFWGTSIESKKHNQNTACYIDAAVYSFKADHLKEDFLNHFPNDKKDIEKIFTINEGIMKEMFSGGAPKPPYEMSLFQLLQFGIRNMMKKPLLMKYGMKNFSSTIRKLSKNNILAAIMLSKAAVTNKMVYFAYAYRWWAMNNSYYPEGGMQSIPDKAVEIFKQHNGTFLLNTEVAKIITEAGKAIGVRTKQGDEYFAERIISNISPSFTYSLLPDDCIEKSKMMQKIQNKKIFPASCLLLMTIDNVESLNGNNTLYIADSLSHTIDEKNYTPENCPITIQVKDKKPNDAFYPVEIIFPIPYAYMNCWNTNGTKVRGKKYRELKEKVKDIILNRIYEKLGPAFKASVTYTELATPLTFERYTNSTEGSFMGWAIDKANYGKFMKHKTDVPNLYLVGQWTFPGFGIAGVMASGYYLTKDLLKDDGVDLEKEFAAIF